MVKERDYQAQLIQRLKREFPSCIILKNDSAYIQGIPDLAVLFNKQWAMLEVKASEDSVVQPNQGYYIQTLNKMSFAAFIYPENEEEVLDTLETFFYTGPKKRKSRIKPRYPDERDQ